MGPAVFIRLPMHGFTTVRIPIAWVAVALAVLFTGCTRDTLFKRLSPEDTGIGFRNDLPADTSFNILNYLYYYDGGGVAAGDVNGDGLVDLYFTASALPNRLYLNRGDLRFEDVTAEAGVAGEGDWSKGVAMADINGDGLLDIHVSNVAFLNKQGRNELFINNGDGTFTDQAASYGLAHEGFSTQAAFFDYDGDGDLDMYLLNHSLHIEDTYGPDTLRYERHPRAGDKLFRNDGPFFTDVSESAGVYGGRIGYGLGIVTSDFDSDGCPDIFVSNDFHEHDYLYYNNCDGTFEESIRTAMGHTSRASMGNDAADFNNDGRIDLMVLDMLPERQEYRNRSDIGEPQEIYDLKRRFGYHHQVVRNTLQLNRGLRRFSEIGYLAGVEATDWSWGSLFADFDNDGRQDVFVTNGIPRRPNDLDYAQLAASPGVQAALARKITPETYALIERMPEVRIANYAFGNDGGLTFTDRTRAWGLDDPGFSNGVVYADLDNDGDLDLVVNNIDEPAAVYENRADRLPDRHSVRVRLEGQGANTAGIGTKVILRTQGTVQVREHMPVRGWQSSVDPRLHIGLGAAATIDTLLVIWPDGRRQTLTDVAADRMLVLRQEDATEIHRSPPQPVPLFEDVTSSFDFSFRHEENVYFDFNREGLMPHKISTEGPAFTIGDVNGDGRADVFAGGAKRQAARLFLQRPDGLFAPGPDAPWRADSLHEDVDAAFFDANGDGALDLYVVSGGNEYWGQAEALLDRLYLGDGAGGFVRDSGALPPRYVNGCCVAPHDFDGDGDMDLFAGGRVEANNYGEIPRSYLLENDGSGKFADVTEAYAPGLSRVGMVGGAAWTDYDGDGQTDLIVAGEWMSVRVFAQRDGRFVEQPVPGLEGSEGWWQTVAVEDMDDDGDPDLILGNLGRNSSVQADEDAPALLYIHDFDANGNTDHILTVARDEGRYPIATRDEIIRQIPSLLRTFPTYADFGEGRYEDLFTADERADALVRQAHTLASAWAENRGDGSFTLHELPAEAQFFPVYAILPGDFDGDGYKDLILGGNFYGVRPSRGRYDAGYGLLLRGDGKGGFQAVDLAESNLLLEGEVRALRLLPHESGPLLFAARNDDTVKVLRLRAAALSGVVQDSSATRGP